MSHVLFLSFYLGYNYSVYNAMCGECTCTSCPLFSSQSGSSDLAPPRPGIVAALTGAGLQPLSPAQAAQLCEQGRELSCITCVPGGCWSCWVPPCFCCLFFNLNCEIPQPRLEAMGSSEMLGFPPSWGRNLVCSPTGHSARPSSLRGG